MMVFDRTTEYNFNVRYRDVGTSLVFTTLCSIFSSSVRDGRYNFFVFIFINCAIVDLGVAPNTFLDHHRFNLELQRPKESVSWPTNYQKQQ